MKRIVPSFTFIGSVVSLTIYAVTVPPSPGTVSVSPASGIAGEFGTWTVAYEVGEGGIAEGGAIRVQLPDTWHAGPRNSANRLQATDPTDDHFVRAMASREGVRLKTIVEEESDRTLVKHAKSSLDGRLERYVFVVRVEVTQGELKSRDEIRVVYGDTSEGSRGYRAGAVTAGPEPVLVAVDAEGDGDFELHSDRPKLRLLPGNPVELQMHAPSNAVVGQEFRVLLSMVDKEDNAAHAVDNVKLSIAEGSADVPQSVRFPEGRKRSGFLVTPTKAGVLRLKAASDKWVLSAQSNPVLVSDEAPEAKIYWGDLHSHSKYSWDGVGSDNFNHARWVAGLDFYAMTDHSRSAQNGMPRGLGPETWVEYTKLTEQHHAPGEFVTLHAYEASFGTPYGHHNVYFRGGPGQLLSPESNSLPEFWEVLTAGDALTIPHHTGKFPNGLDFSIHDERFRRNFEIYSAHGLSEAGDPDHPLSFERSTFTAPSSTLADQPSHAQDAWRMGLRVSTVAASDDHRAHPGLPHWGLTAVYGPELTRDAIFQALYDRRTYGTTGAKIILEFSVNDTPMGDVGIVEDGAMARIRAIGTDVISRVELMRYTADAGWDLVQSWHPDAPDFEATYRDEGAGPAMYYVRLRQAAPVRDRIAMAWSSPVWLE